MKEVNQTRRAKIMATLGPASMDRESISQLLQAGVDVFRLNFSHSKHSDFESVVSLIRQLESELNYQVAILLDLQGPKIRTGTCSKKEGIAVAEGSLWTIYPRETATVEGKFSISYVELLKDSQVGHIILIDDGKLRFEVTEKTTEFIKAKALQEGRLFGHKGVHFPNMQLTASSLTEKDFVDLNIGLKLDVDFVALSFVRRPQDIRYLKDFLRARQKSCGIVAKIEREEALDHIDEIIEEADAIMVARGDMAIELGPERVPHVQKSIIRKCNRAAKPVITATEMLLSMVSNLTPTRAEASDVANAIMDGTDVLMLSNETAVGKHPVDAVTMMDRIIHQTEAEFTFSARLQKSVSRELHQASLAEAVIRSSFTIAEAIQAKAIFSVSTELLSARLLTRYRPSVPLFAVVDSLVECRRLKMLWGVQGVYLSTFPAPLELFDRIGNEAIARGVVQQGDRVVITAGLPHLLHNPTNSIKVIEVD